MSSRPGARPVCVLLFIVRLALIAFTPLRRRDQGAVLAVRRENAVKPGEIDSWPGHQCGQPGNEIERFEDDVVVPSR